MIFFITSIHCSILRSLFSSWASRWQLMNRKLLAPRSKDTLRAALFGILMFLKDKPRPRGSPVVYIFPTREKYSFLIKTIISIEAMHACFKSKYSEEPFSSSYVWIVNLYPSCMISWFKLKYYLMQDIRFYFFSLKRLLTIDLSASCVENTIMSCLYCELENKSSIWFMASEYLFSYLLSI